MSEKLHALGDALFRAFPQADILRTQVPQWVQAHGELVWLYTGVTRFLFPLLALLILVRAIRGLLRIALSYLLAGAFLNMAIAYAEGLHWIFMVLCFLPFFLRKDRWI